MTWLYPSFLWALLVLLIPIIVHLFNFRRYKKIAFTNLRFLRQINQQTKSGNQLRRYLILASRLLALSFLVFAFAQPIILKKGQLLSRSKSQISLIIDNSYSMNNDGEEGPLLEAAKNRARAIVNSANNNDEFQIITADMNAAFMHTGNKESTLENIDKIKINSGGKPLSQLLQLQNRLSYQFSGNKRQFVISDFQRNNTPSKTNQYDSGIEKLWVKINSESAENISIDTCYLNSPVLQAGETISMTAVVSNYSKNEILGFTVDLMVDNKPKGIAVFDIKPFSKSAQVLNFVLETGGNHQCVLTHKGDKIGFDDKLFFSLNLKSDYSVINIFDKKTPYIFNIFNETKGFSITEFLSGSVQYNLFGKAALISVEGSKNLSSGMVTELKKYAEKGGNLFIFPQADLPYGGLDLLAGSFGFKIDASPTILNGKVSDFDTENPLFRNIFVKTPKNPDLPSVSKYYPITSGNSQTIMKLNNDASFLLTTKLKKGNVYICSSPLNIAYTNFQNHAFFVPVMLRSALLSSYQSELYYQCGQTENISTGIPFSAEGGIVLKYQNNSFIPEVINTNGEIFLNTNGEIEEPGWYTLYKNKGDSSLLSLSFNLDRRESDTRTYSDSELENLAEQNDATVFSASAEQLAAEYNADTKGQPLWKWCIIFVLIFLMIEILLIRFLKPNAKLST